VPAVPAARVLWSGIACVLVAVAAACTPSPADPGPQPSDPLYRDPDTQVADWVASHPSDARTPVLRDRIAARPQARWFTQANPSTIAAEVRSYVGPAAASGAVPVLVPYAIPQRDCGGASDGGAAALSTWRAWVDAMAGALGDTPAIVVLEPDALALEDCLSVAQRDARRAALAAAVRSFASAAPGTDVYLDAGHSAWHGAAEQARRLRAAGALDAAGFATNVSNYRTTADEVAYGRALIAELGDPSLRQVIDTSRNGNGPAGTEWCDPAGRAIGRAPTLATGEPTVAAYLWVKLPGEADGCAGAAGQFLPDLAYALATN